MSSPHDRIRAAIDGARPALERVALAIHERPELRFQERFAAGLLVGELEALGLSVERGLAGMETSFAAEMGTDEPGAPVVAVVAEYDALPGIGHACGHHLIAAGALGAVIGLHAVANELPGRVRVLGTPAEEGGGGKVKLIKVGVFDGLAAAMMFHPFDQDLLWKDALAAEEVQLDFRGRASHAAAAPWRGDSALNAVIQTFNLVDSLRVHLKDGTRLHGFIHDGGDAVNIIPDHAGCRFSVRGRTIADKEDVRDRLIECGRAAAAATRTEVDIEVFDGYRDMRNNRALFERWGAHFGPAAVEPLPLQGGGSTDMGDVSHVCPSIHPYVAICDQGQSIIHNASFAALAVQPRAMDAMLHAAGTMACTAWDVLADDALREAAAREFESVEGG